MVEVAKSVDNEVGDGAACGSGSNWSFLLEKAEQLILRMYTQLSS